jgi:hypothetical protein
LFWCELKSLMCFVVRAEMSVTPMRHNCDSCPKVLHEDVEFDDKIRRVQLRSYLRK